MCSYPNEFRRGRHRQYTRSCFLVCDLVNIWRTRGRDQRSSQIGCDYRGFWAAWREYLFAINRKHTAGGHANSPDKRRRVQLPVRIAWTRNGALEVFLLTNSPLSRDDCFSNEYLLGDAFRSKTGPGVFGLCNRSHSTRAQLGTAGSDRDGEAAGKSMPLLGREAGFILHCGLPRGHFRVQAASFSNAEPQA